MASYLRPRRGKKSTAIAQEVILKKGEIFFEVPETGVGTGIGKIKMGNGTSTYSQLPYFSEQVDVANSNITFTEDTNTDNTTLLNKVVTGGKLNIIIGAIKKLLNNFNTSINSLNSKINNTATKLNLSEIQSVEQSYIYVSPNGSDTTGNGTSSKPYRTISRGIKDIPDAMYINGSDGTNYDTKKQLRVQGGTYNESIYTVGKEFTICLTGNVVINATTNTTFNLSRGSKVTITSLDSSTTTKYSLTLNCLSTAQDSIAAYVESNSILRFVSLKDVIVENCKSYIFYSYTGSVIEAHISCDNLQINNSCASTYDCALFGSVFSANIMINCASLTIQSNVGKTRFAIASINSFVGFVVKNGVNITDKFTYALVSYYCSSICIFDTYAWVDNSTYKNSTDYGGEIKIGMQNTKLQTINLKSNDNTIDANGTSIITIDTSSIGDRYNLLSIAGWYLSNTNCNLIYIRPVTNAIEVFLKNTSSTSITVSLTINLAIKQVV